MLNSMLCIFSLLLLVSVLCGVGVVSVGVFSVVVVVGLCYGLLGLLGLVLFFLVVSVLVLMGWCCSDLVFVNG